MPAEDGSELAIGAARFLLDQKEELKLPLLSIVAQEEFLREAATGPSMTVEEKRALLDQTELVLRDLYAHLPFKPVFQSTDPNVNPLIGLSTLREQVETLSDFDFHTCMLIALAGAKDIHTSYTAPSPYSGAVAFLPFQLRFYEHPKGQLHFVVAKTMTTSKGNGFAHSHFRVGSEIFRWNGLHPKDAAMSAAQLQPGANPDAELSRGTARLTIRSVGSHSVASPGGIPPFQAENSVKIRYAAPGETHTREIVFPWQVATGFGATPFSSTAFSHSDAMTHLQQWSRCSYRPEQLAAKPADEQDFFEARFAGDPPESNAPSPELLRNPHDPEWPFAYLRLRHFATDAPSILEDAKFRQVKEALARFDREARGGLIVDIRGNPGGQIRLAERMLQLLSPRAIEPLRFHFPRTPLVEKVIEVLRSSGLPSGEFTAWLEPQPGDDLSANAPLTPGRTITATGRANDTGQVYQGPVVLLFDALTYSAADMFAAGFEDHGIGELIGVDCSTGGGGANAWSYDDIVDNLPEIPGVQLPKLPQDCRLNVAVRRCTRVGPGQPPIEGVGVAPTFLHVRTKRDVLEGNQDLFRFACERLAAAPLCRIDVQKVERVPEGLSVTLSTVGVRFVVLRSETQVVASGAVNEYEPQSFSVPASSGTVPSLLHLEGYANAEEPAGQVPPLAAPRLTVGSPVLGSTPSRSQRAAADLRTARPSSYA